MNHLDLLALTTNRREELGLTQRQLAKLSGVDLRTIQEYDEGRRNPHFDKFIKLVHALGMEMYLVKRKPVVWTRIKQHSDLGKILKERREELELSVFQLMIATEITDTRICQIEQAQTGSTLAVLLRLAPALDLEVSFKAKVNTKTVKMNIASRKTSAITNPLDSPASMSIASHKINTMTNPLDFLGLMRSRRENLGLTQKRLAEISGVALRTIKEYDEGRGCPQFDKFIKLVHALRMEMHVVKRKPVVLTIVKQKSDLGKVIKERRDQLGLSVIQLMIASGVSNATIYGIEQMKAASLLPALLKLGHALDLEISLHARK